MSRTVRMRYAWLCREKLIAEVRRQCGNQEEGERPPLEAGARTLVGTQQVCALVSCQVRKLLKLL
jgi:hypothetical protein